MIECTLSFTLKINGVVPFGSYLPLPKTFTLTPLGILCNSVNYIKNIAHDLY